MYQEDNDRLTAELRSKTSEIVACKDALSVTEDENLSLRNELARLKSLRTTRTFTDDAGDDSHFDTPRETDTVDYEKLRGLLIQLQYLVGPDFGDHKYFDFDRLTHDVIDVFRRDIPMADQKAFIRALNSYAAVEDTEEISDTTFTYNLYSYLIGKQPPSTTSRRRKGPASIEEIATEGETGGHESDSEKNKVPLQKVVEGTLRSASKGSVVVNMKSEACMPILQLLTDLKLMHACM